MGREETYVIVLNVLSANLSNLPFISVVIHKKSVWSKKEREKREIRKTGEIV